MPATRSTAQRGHQAELAAAVELLLHSGADELAAAISAASTPTASRRLRSVLDLVTYRDAVMRLEYDLANLPAAVPPAASRAAQATENAWRAMQDEFGLLTAVEVAAQAGASRSNRTYASDQRRRGRLLGIKRRNAYLYPGFQFDPDSTSVRPVIGPLLASAALHERSSESVALWLTSPTTYLDGDRPVDHIDDADQVLAAAEGAWGVEW